MPHKHCAYSNCASDSRKNQPVKFIRFINPQIHLERAKRWVQLCGREHSSIDSVTQDTYICSLHFRDGDELDPRANKLLEPFPANSLTVPKRRKSPVKRHGAIIYGDLDKLPNLAKSACRSYGGSTKKVQKFYFHIPVRIPSSECTIDLLSASNEEETNEVVESKAPFVRKPEAFQRQSTVVTDFIMANEEKAKFFTGLTTGERHCLWEFLGPARDTLQIVGRCQGTISGKLRCMSVRCQFLMTLMILRRSKTFDEVHHMFNISETIISGIFKTWLLFMYWTFHDIRDKMFVKRKDIPKPLPAQFFAYSTTRDVSETNYIFNYIF